MNDLDDYDFGSGEKSHLSSLFDNEEVFEFGNNALIYKAPKQPVAKGSTTSNSFYKFFQLYEIVDGVEHKLGKYIIALIISDFSEILIYQNKRNILIRRIIDENLNISNFSRKFCLDLLEKSKHFILEFSNQDFNEFISEFQKYGGKIINSISKKLNKEIDEDKKLPLLSQVSVLTNLTSSLSVSSILDPPENINVDTSIKNESNQSKNEKEDILARLAKMGLPQLPSFQKQEKKNVPIKDESYKIENISNIESNDSDVSKNEISYSSISSNSIEDYINKDELQEYQPDNFNTEIMKIKENYHTNPCTEQMKMISNMNSIDPISLILTENRLNNADLKHQISLLTSNLNKVMNSETSNDGKTSQLESKLKSFKLQSENLKRDLRESMKECEVLRKRNMELEAKVEKSSKFSQDKKSKDSQTDEKFHSESSIETQFKQLLYFMHNLPLKPVEIDLDILKNIEENIDNEDLSQCVETSINIFSQNVSQKEQFINDISRMRDNFIQETKEGMSDMYENLNSLFENGYTRSTIANQMKNLTAEVVRNYDKLIQECLQKYF